MRIDCHAHTRTYSSCSSLRPAELCSLALERGLHGIVITEHRRQWPPEDLDMLRQRFPRLAIYSGVEISTVEGYDVVLISDLRLDLPDFPSASHLRRLFDEHDEEIFSFVAHPFRYRNMMTEDLQRILQVVEGIEMNSVNILKSGPEELDGRFEPDNRDKYLQARQKYNLLPLYNTDTHAKDSVAALANELPCDVPPTDAKGLIRLLRSGAGKQWQDPARIERFLEHTYLF